MMKARTASIILSLLILSATASAQLTDGGFELGTFNSAVLSGPNAVFINAPCQAYEGSSFGAISVIAPSSGSLRMLMSFEAGLVEPGTVHTFSFFAKKPDTNGFNQINISASGGGPEALISRVTLEAPSSLTAVWMIHSYQFTIPANWNPESIMRISLSTEPISLVTSGQTYSFHLDNFTLTTLETASIPEPQAAAIGAGIAVLLAGVTRRRRSSFL